MTPTDCRLPDLGLGQVGQGFWPRQKITNKPIMMVSPRPPSTVLFYCLLCFFVVITENKTSAELNRKLLSTVLIVLEHEQYCKICQGLFFQNSYFGMDGILRYRYGPTSQNQNKGRVQWLIDCLITDQQRSLKQQGHQSLGTDPVRLNVGTIAHGPNSEL